MNKAIPLHRPMGAASWQRSGKRLMDIIVHAGAHRTATTSFQHYMRGEASTISATATAVWGPRRTRNGLFAGLFPDKRQPNCKTTPDRVRGRLALQLARTAQKGAERLLISDENMIGTSRHCVRTGQFFPAAGERMAQFAAAFDGRVSRVILSIRSPESWWASAVAYAISRGHTVPDRAKLDRIADMPRSWRDVVTDLACAMPDADLIVAPFEEWAGRPDAFLAQAIGVNAPKDTQNHWLNRAPDLPKLRALLVKRGDSPDLLPDGTGKWLPFDDRQMAAMRETYADDLFWLAAGADGLARLTENPARTRTGPSLRADHMTEGQGHDNRYGKMARSG